MVVRRPLREGTHRIKSFLHLDVFGDFQAVWRLRVGDDS